MADRGCKMDDLCFHVASGCAGVHRGSRSKATMGEERDAANGLYMDNKADLESTIDAVASAITALEASRREHSNNRRQIGINNHASHHHIE